MFGFASLLYLQNQNEIISMLQGCSEKIWQRESIYQNCRPQTSFAIISQRNLIFIWELLTNKTRIACSDLIWQIWLDWFVVKIWQGVKIDPSCRRQTSFSSISHTEINGSQMWVTHLYNSSNQKNITLLDKQCLLVCGFDSLACLWHFNQYNPRATSIKLLRTLLEWLACE